MIDQKELPDDDACKDGQNDGEKGACIDFHPLDEDISKHQQNKHAGGGQQVFDKEKNRGFHFKNIGQERVHLMGPVVEQDSGHHCIEDAEKQNQYDGRKNR